MKDSLSRQQVNLGHQYYNLLAEAENRRRQLSKIAISGPKPPHSSHADNEPPCKECQDFWEVMRGRMRCIPPLDVKPLRAEAVKNGLYWGTYLLIEQAFADAWKKTDWFSPVKFKSWREGGIMGVQIQQKIQPEAQFKIVKAADHRTGRRAGQRHILYIRIGSHKRAPVWSDPIAFEMHRPLQGRVTWVAVCVQYRGSHEEWSVNFTCNEVPARTDNATEGHVAIDVGWRLLPSGETRIAFATASDGAEFELKLDERWRERSLRADRIRSYRDKRLNDLKAADSRFALLKSPRRVCFYARKRDIISEYLNEWIKRERHLEDYELGCRRKTFAVRRDAVRVWLRMLRRGYAIAIIKDSSHKEMKDAKKAKEAGMPRAARRQGHHAAPGEVIEEVCRVFNREMNVAVVAAPLTTATCRQCGHINKVGPELIVKCERCNAEDDRDRISTRNLLDQYASGNGKKPPARKVTARFAKRHNKLNQPKECQLNG